MCYEKKEDKEVDGKEPRDPHSHRGGCPPAVTSAPGHSLIFSEPQTPRYFQNVQSYMREILTSEPGFLACEMGIAPPALPA